MEKSRPALGMPVELLLVPPTDMCYLKLERKMQRLQTKYSAEKLYQQPYIDSNTSKLSRSSQQALELFCDAQQIIFGLQI